MITPREHAKNTTVKFPDKIKRLILRDAKREGHLNISIIVRNIVAKHYGFLTVNGKNGNYTP